MSAIAALPFDAPPAVAKTPCPEILDDLRQAALFCQTCPRLDLFHACQMLSEDGAQSRVAFRDALLRSLSQGLDRRLVLFRPGSGELSFDERWLLALADAVARDDAHSAEFLLRSRVRPQARQSLLFLVSGLMRHLEQI